MANMAEGLGRSGDREFLQFLAIAKGSAHEVASHLHVALDQGYVTQEQFDEISLRTGEVGRMLGGLNEYLRESRMEGSRLRPSGADAD